MPERLRQIEEERLKKLEQRKLEIFAELRSHNPEAAKELWDILEIQRTSDASYRYTGIEFATDAITDVLERLGRTENREAIEKAVVDGGYRRGKPNAERNVKGSITYLLNNVELKKAIKTFPSGKIGLYAWTDHFDQK